MPDKPTKIAVTMGDPAGVGPELCIQLLNQWDHSLSSVDFKIYGDYDLLTKVAKITNQKRINKQFVVNLNNQNFDFQPGQISPEGGRASYNFLEQAIRDALDKKVDAIVTAPINKESLRAAGIRFPGHTEILTHLTKSTKTCMLQYSDEITASFVTCHCGYNEVLRQLSRKRIREVIDLTDVSLTKILNRRPTLIALGLNPHAGENGLFGANEEEQIILPEIVEAQKRGVQISGPIPPDTAFIPSKRQSTDGFICMYHDQGHIPLKALAFDSAVNVTLGLPIIRTSVDHGTAFDIAWKGIANPGSIFEATKLAISLAKKS